MRRYDMQVPECSRLRGLAASEINGGGGEGLVVKQTELVQKVQKIKLDSLEEGASTVDRARLKGVSAAHAGAFLVAAPSRGLDMLLTNEEVSSRVGRRLGIAICEEQTCPFCFGIMDRFGIHAESCMAGGDKTAAHHCVRNDVYHHAGRGNTGPVLEAAGVLDMLGVQDAQGRLGERPADVLLCSAQGVRTGIGARGRPRVALDIGIVCPQAASHLEAAAMEIVGAAEEYVRTKAARRDIERRCAEVGVVFQTMIFESLGGVSVEAEGVIKCLNKLVAFNTGSSVGEVAPLFWQRLSIDIQRAGHRAFARRMSHRTGFQNEGVGWGGRSGSSVLEAPSGA